MAPQYDFGNLESPVSGTALVNTHLEPWRDALHSCHSGTSRPSYAVAGTIWRDTTSTPWLVKMYDGADDITIGAVNASTNAFTAYHGTAALRLLNHATDTGSANAYAVAPVPAITAYATGMVVTMTPANNQTAAATLAVSGLTAKNIKTLAGADPASGMIVTTGTYSFIYDGTNWVVQNPSVVVTQSARDNSGKPASTAYVDDGDSTIPQNSKSAAYTTVLADAGKAIFHPAADTTARTFTIDSNANVAYPVSTTLTFVNEHGAGVVTIAITSDTMRLAGAGTTGSRTLAADGIATAYKMTSTSWLISGAGLT